MPSSTTWPGWGGPTATRSFLPGRNWWKNSTWRSIGRSAGVFDPDKLTALNADHIRAASVRHLAPRVLPFFREKGYDAADDDYLAGVIGTLHTRSKTLVEMADGAHFYYRDDVRPYDEKAAKKFLKPEMARY
jgi:glutamyl-tRNA synthetase